MNMSDVTKKSLLALTALIVLTLIVLFLVAQFVKPKPDWLTWMPIFGSNTTNTSGTGTGTGTDTDVSTIINKLKALGESVDKDLSTLLNNYNTYKKAVLDTKAAYDVALLKINSINTAAATNNAFTTSQTSLNILYATLSANISGFADFINNAAKTEAGTNTLTAKSNEYLANSQKISSDIVTLLGQITTYLSANDTATSELTTLLATITSLSTAVATGPTILGSFTALKDQLVSGVTTAINALSNVTISPDDLAFFNAAKKRVSDMIELINTTSSNITTKLITITNANTSISATINLTVNDLNTKSTSLVNIAKTLKDYKTEITSRQTIEGKRAADLTLVNSIFQQNAKLDIALTQLTTFYTAINV